MATITIHRTRNGILRSADSATVLIATSNGSIIIPESLVSPVSEGIYSYEADGLSSGSYRATWTFSSADSVDGDVITRLFTIDAPAFLSEGVTLADIEAMTMRRCGPYKKVRATLGSTVSRLSAAALTTSIPQGGYEEQFILRRGITMDGTWVPIFTQDDRVRQVAIYEFEDGRLFADREWTNAPDSTSGEAVEIQALDPEHEIRPCVLEGLKRCFFWDTVSVGLVSSEVSYNANLTASVPWITDPSQIREVSFAYANQLVPPSVVPWWKAYRSGKDVWVRSQGAFIGSLVIDVLRPASSLVNGETSLNGPNDDLDVLYIDKSYAAWASIIELWKEHADRLMPLTHEGLGTALKTAAAEFTKQGMMVANQMPERVRLQFGPSDLATMQIGNLAEPV